MFELSPCFNVHVNKGYGVHASDVCEACPFEYLFSRDLGVCTGDMCPWRGVFMEAVFISL